MSSTFTWLDHSEEQRRRVLDVLDLFRERTTVDELGLGTVRDAFADMLFPGTGAPQTRARYFLFVPWTYIKLEGARVASAEVSRRARKDELRLVSSLLDNGETDGVIGKLAKGALQRLPSSIYWTGLRRLGICLFDGSQDTYHKSLDTFYRRLNAGIRTDDGELIDSLSSNWHRNIPKAPATFPDKPSLVLTRREAEYLRERIVLSAPSSLFAQIVTVAKATDEAEYPWAHPRLGDFSSVVNQQLGHGRNFSELMHGAALLYNLQLAELTPPQEWVGRYRDALAEWGQIIETRMPVLDSWKKVDFWQCVESEGVQVGFHTRAFVEKWWDLAVIQRGYRNISDLREARDLIHRRERSLKGARSRIDNPNARRLWGGESGTGRLVYRWSNAQRIARDILESLEGNGDA